MGLNNSNKIISADRIDCSGSLKVTLALSRFAGYHGKSYGYCPDLGPFGEHGGKPPGESEGGSKKFIDIIEESTGGTQDGTIGSGSRMELSASRVRRFRTHS